MEESQSVEQAFNPPGIDTPISMSWEEHVKQEQANSPYFSQLPTGEYLVKFLGAEMVNTNYGISPRYRFVLNGVEKQLDSKSKSLHSLAGRQGQMVKVIKSIDAKTGKNSYLVR